MNRVRLVLASALVVLMLCGARELQAQAAAGTEPTRLLVTRYALKPDHVAQWLMLQRQDVLPALRKAGVAHVATYETILGDAPEFTSVRSFAGFEEFDGPDPLSRALGDSAAARLWARLAECTQSMHRSIENRRDEFFIDPGNAPIQYASKYRAMPGKSQAYMEFFRAEMMPVMRRAKENGTFAGLDVTVSAHGGEWGLITLNMYYATFAPLDGEPPVAKTLGPEGTRALLAKGTGLITPLEWIVRKRVPELSY